MAIEVTARHMDPTDALQGYARTRGAELVAEFPRIEHVHIILSQEKHRQIAQVVVQARNHIRLEADEDTENMRASLDAAMEKITRQLRRLRDKVQDHKAAMKHGEAARARMEPEAEPEGEEAT